MSNAFLLKKIIFAQKTSDNQADLIVIKNKIHVHVFG